MKAARILAVAALAAVPAWLFADTAGHGLTRADVRAELVRLEQAGYHPAQSEPHYPDDIAAALQVARSDQNGPSKSQGDNMADASAPAGHRDAPSRAGRNAADDLYAHS
ncbi:hypothetical protein GQ56_0109020 [Burkholderia paludis]|uniref:DUF4148 domain-containing protein n=1 Tax=Burkholderia paludis TaxID=1506587 RepID=UPI0004DB709F|nr:DUF4148 domain-containing protein [Burkholderia paludis]KFG97660.1 hypothetical protein GQ56_0109020 [Burkholderia paludis]